MGDDLEWAKLHAPNKEALWSDWDRRHEEKLQTNTAGTGQFGGDVVFDWKKLGLESHKAVIARAEVAASKELVDADIAAELAAVQKAAEIAAELAASEDLLVADLAAEQAAQQEPCTPKTESRVIENKQTKDDSFADLKANDLLATCLREEMEKCSKLAEENNELQNTLADELNRYAELEKELAMSRADLNKVLDVKMSLSKGIAEDKRWIVWLERGNQTTSKLDTRLGLGKQYATSVEEVRRLGAKPPSAQSSWEWFVPAGMQLRPFVKWLKF